MKLCPKCKIRYMYDEQEQCSYCQKLSPNRTRDEEIAEETRRRRQVRNRVMGNNLRRH